MKSVFACNVVTSLTISSPQTNREGIWTRCFPAMRKTRELIAQGAIGRPVCVQGDFGWSTTDTGENDRIWYPDSGGFTYDVGMYLAHLGQLAYPDQDVEQIQAMGTKKNGVDLSVLANLKYDKGGLLQFYVTGDANTEERVCIQGTKGRIIMDPPAHIPTTIRLFTDEGRGLSTETVYDFPLPDDTYTSWNYPRSIGFCYEVETVSKALRAGKKECKEMTHKDSLQLAAIIDEVRGQVLDNDVSTADKAEDREDVPSERAIVA
jgi:dihydrodiol dehydrogenase / D-xylose 1-dehydrogenase (NADP)